MKQLVKKLFFPVIGLASLLWFLVRVVPKPSRASYPCMRVAFPVASSFIIYLAGLFASVVVFKKAQKYLHESRYFLFTLAIILGTFLGLAAYLHTNYKAIANYQSTTEGPNMPMGEGKGIFPGRVVWIHNPDATDATCKNSTNDYWCDDGNTNQAEVNEMVSQAIQWLTGTTTDPAAWDAIFRFYNKNHGKGDVGYTSGEKIVIKINLNSGVSGSTNTRWNKTNIDTSPHIVEAILDQLVNKAGVPQANIGFGDPGKNVDNIFWDKFHSKFPNVKYWGEGSGRTPIVQSQNLVLFASNGEMDDWLPQCYLDADYMINIPVFKKHHRAGISMCSKNHFGSIVPFRGSAFHWHFSLPCSEGGGDVNNPDYGQYRCFVDIMGHKDLGGKTILFLVDGIWSSTNWAHPPIKWRMEPFNNDWPSSIFASLDPVAIESVGFDFLFYEFDENHPTEGQYDPADNKGPFPHYAGTQDFLHQAADAANRPAGLTYDPEDDGTPLPNSMGVHEHWNNVTEKKYSRNLGLNTGIELVSTYNPPTGVDPRPARLVENFNLEQNYPNPFNATTVIQYSLHSPSRVTLAIYNTTGQLLRTLVDEYQNAGSHVQNWDGYTEQGHQAPSGIYFYKITAQNNAKIFNDTKAMVLAK
ncbi:MAG TPA: DUF362 domain-containing protein [bacterium]|nr:DUF362 domain-containing protein [bacterium]HPN44732.1 DUF362 domain-containing protein [bacterium]